MTEDDILDRFECYELREEINILKGKLALARVKKDNNVTRAAVNRMLDAEQRAVAAEAKYEAVLRRNVVLNRRVKELGG